MKNARKIILAPLITEKNNSLKERYNSYAFKVDVDANKIEIKNAIEEIFHVNIEKVNTINQRGKVKKMNRYSGKRADWKKAIIKLRQGDSIELAEL